MPRSSRPPRTNASHDELEHRTGPLRLEISERIERARELGDIKENADYDAAKNEQGLNEARVRQLEEMLRDVVIVEAADGDVVEAGVDRRGPRRRRRRDPDLPHRLDRGAPRRVRRALHQRADGPGAPRQARRRRR